METIWRHRRNTTDIKNRAVGCLLGLACGDALGTTLEFTFRDAQPALTDMVGGGPFHLPVGFWTDDTSQSLALADSLLHDPDLDPGDLMDRFVSWWRHGTYSCTGDCFDIGTTTAHALERYEDTGDPIAGSTDPRNAPNGSLMRLAPVAIRFWDDPDRLSGVAARQSRTTHGAPEAVDACVAFAQVLADAIAGKDREYVLRSRSGPFAGNVAGIMAGGWRLKLREQIESSGYVCHSLEAAMWCVGNTDDFASAVLLAANLGDDADTVGAITGQLAGALYGFDTIPLNWLSKLGWSKRIEDVAAKLFVASVDSDVDASGLRRKSPV